MAFLGAGLDGATLPAEPLTKKRQNAGIKGEGKRGSSFTPFSEQLVHLELLEEELGRCANELQAD